MSTNYQSKRNNCILWVLVLTITFLAACSDHSISEKESAFRNLFPNVEFNKGFQISVDRNQINLKEGPFIFLGLENLSSSMIEFPRDDSGVSILTYSKAKNQWQEINNDITYITEKAPKLYPRNEGPLRFLGITVSPMIDNIDQDVDIRVVVTGTISEAQENIGKQVGAYIDITLTP